MEQIWSTIHNTGHQITTGLRPRNGLEMSTHPKVALMLTRDSYLLPYIFLCVISVISVNLQPILPRTVVLVRVFLPRCGKKGRIYDMYLTHPRYVTKVDDACFKIRHVKFVYFFLNSNFDC